MGNRKKAAIVRLLFALSVLVLWSHSQKNEIINALNFGGFENMAGSPLADQRLCRSAVSSLVI